MVKIGRHGENKLDNKPCRNQYGGYTSLRTLRTSRLCRVIGSALDGIRTQNTSLVQNYPVDKYFYSNSCSSQTFCSNPNSDFNHIYNNNTYKQVNECTYLCLPYQYITSRNAPSTCQIKPKSRPSRIAQTDFRRNTSTRTLIFLFVSMFLCDSWVCAVHSVQSESFNDSLSEIRKYIESKYGAISVQCLTMTGNFSETICKNLTGRDRRIIGEVNTNFCGLPFNGILSDEEKYSVTLGRSDSCTRILRTKQNNDDFLSNLYCEFIDVLERMDCNNESYGCELCKTNYKQWLCSVYTNYYYGNEPVKPCIDFCDRVQESCPFFRPMGEMLIGEPGFLCKDPKSFDDNDFAFYGQEGCCYRPCHVFETPGHVDCPPLNITSNCTIQTNSAPATCTSSPQSHVIVIVLCSILCSLFVFDYHLQSLTKV